MALDVNAILGAVSRMFPSVDIQGAMQKAQNALQGVPNTLEGASQAARNLGITPQAVNDIFAKYGNTMQAQAICRMFGTTPQALKNDADRILGGVAQSNATGNSNPVKATKFPRLK